MSVLDAELSILDEIDSGLDIDALKDVASAVNGLKKAETATIMVTHYKVGKLCCERWCSSQRSMTSLQNWFC